MKNHKNTFKKKKKLLNMKTIKPKNKNRNNNNKSKNC